MHFVSLLIELRSMPPGHLTPVYGVYAHGAVLQLLSATSPEAGRALHDATRCKPLSLAVISSRQCGVNLRVALLADRALDYANMLVKALTTTTQVRLDCHTYTIDGLSLGQVATWSDFMAFCAKRISIRFITPTAITKDTTTGGRYTLLYPEPVSVFGGLARRWSDLGGPLLPLDLLGAIGGGGCVIARHKLQTVEFKTRERTQIGFTGDVIYNCRSAAPEQQQALTALARLAQFSGIGYQIARGMGAVQVEVS